MARPSLRAIPWSARCRRCLLWTSWHSTPDNCYDFGCGPHPRPAVVRASGSWEHHR
jgi:hypothetical protein